MKLSENLPLLLKEKRWTLKKLSAVSGVPVSTLSGWTAGKSVQNLNQVKAVAAALSVSLHQLLFSEPDPNEQQLSNEALTTLFSGDVRILVQKIDRTKGDKS